MYLMVFIEIIQQFHYHFLINKQIFQLFKLVMDCIFGCTDEPCPPFDVLGSHIIVFNLVHITEMDDDGIDTNVPITIP